MTYNAFSRMNYTLTGDLSTGTLNQQSGVVSPGDETLIEVSGGSVANTFEVGEIYDVGLANTYIYRGYVDSGLGSDRLIIMEDTTNATNFVAFSPIDLPLAIDPSPGNYPDAIAASSIITTNLAHCFVEGTLIATPDGERPVEALAIGDLVSTADGQDVPVKWIGRQHVPYPTLMSLNLEPVCIEADVFGPGVPKQPLHISADHGLIIDGLVINAAALVNGTSIRFAPREEAFTYYHIETEAHDIVLANGLPAETYIDVCGRANFDNGAEYQALYGYEPLIHEIPLPRISAQRLLPNTIKQKLGITSSDPDTELGMTG